MNISLISGRSVIYVACWCNTTVAFMLLWLGHERQGQMWPAEVIWQWSSCYCDMNVSGRCDLLKSYDSDLPVTVTWMSAADVTCWSHIMTVIFMLLWHECQQQMWPAKCHMTVNFTLLWPADIIFQDSSYYCDRHTHVNTISDPLLWYDFDLRVAGTGTETSTVELISNVFVSFRFLKQPHLIIISK